MPTRRWFALVSAVVVWLCVTACGLLGGGTPPVVGGTPYTVNETLTMDTCGQQSDGVQNLTQYNVRLDTNASTGLATWTVAASGASSSGTYDFGPHTFVFTDDETTQVRAAVPAYGLAACSMRRLDVIQGVLASPQQTAFDAGVNEGGVDASATDASNDGGVTYTTFTATETITVGPTSDSDCSDQIGVSNGQFLALPCQQNFTLAGTLTVTP